MEEKKKMYIYKEIRARYFQSIIFSKKQRMTVYCHLKQHNPIYSRVVSIKVVKKIYHSRTRYPNYFLKN